VRRGTGRRGHSCRIAAEVRPQGRVEVLGAVGHHRPQGSQLALAPLRGMGGAGPEVGAVPGDQGGEIGVIHGQSLTAARRVDISPEWGANEEALGVCLLNPECEMELETDPAIAIAR
jgi:hypothetical protein